MKGVLVSMMANAISSAIFFGLYGFFSFTILGMKRRRITMGRRVGVYSYHPSCLVSLQYV